MHLKNLLYLPLLLITLQSVHSQDNVGIGTPTPDSKAILDLTSKEKGILIPRMTSSERLAIAPIGPAQEGLLVYDQDLQKFYYWDGSQWVEVGSGAGVDNDWTVNGNDMYNKANMWSICSSLMPETRYSVRNP